MTSEQSPWLAAVERPIVLATCSTERQNDRVIVEAALGALPDEGYIVAATTAAYDPSVFQEGPYSRVDRFLPHGEIVEHARVVVCHGGMEITQRALSRGVPVMLFHWVAISSRWRGG